MCACMFIRDFFRRGGFEYCIYAVCYYTAVIILKANVCFDVSWFNIVELCFFFYNLVMRGAYLFDIEKLFSFGCREN